MHREPRNEGEGELEDEGESLTITPPALQPADNAHTTHAAPPPPEQRRSCPVYCTALQRRSCPVYSTALHYTALHRTHCTALHCTALVGLAKPDNIVFCLCGVSSGHNIPQICQFVRV